MANKYNPISTFINKPGAGKSTLSPNQVMSNIGVDDMTETKYLDDPNIFKSGIHKNNFPDVQSFPAGNMSYPSMTAINNVNDNDLNSVYTFNNGTVSYAINNDIQKNQEIIDEQKRLIDEQRRLLSNYNLNNMNNISPKANNFTPPQINNNKFISNNNKSEPLVIVVKKKPKEESIVDMCCNVF